MKAMVNQCLHTILDKTAKYREALVRLGVTYYGIYISVRIASYSNAAPSSNFSVKEEHIW